MGEVCLLHRLGEDCNKSPRFLEDWHCLLSTVKHKGRWPLLSSRCRRTQLVPLFKWEVKWGSSSHVAAAKQNLSWPEEKVESVASQVRAWLRNFWLPNLRR